MNPRFLFANLCADVARCIKAAEDSDQERYEGSLARARKTLTYLRASHCPEAYEEGLLLVRGLQLAQEGELGRFAVNVDRLAATLVAA